jgi:hypothetical protein
MFLHRRVAEPKQTNTTQRNMLRVGFDSVITLWEWWKFYALELGRPLQSVSSQYCQNYKKKIAVLPFVLKIYIQCSQLRASQKIVQPPKRRSRTHVTQWQAGNSQMIALYSTLSTEDKTKGSYQHLKKNLRKMKGQDYCRFRLCERYKLKYVSDNYVSLSFTVFIPSCTVGATESWGSQY